MTVSRRCGATSATPTSTVCSLPQNFQPVGETVEEPTGREGTTILYDEFGIAHVTGVTREDLAFSAGWVTARDRDLLLNLGRGPARVAAADIPGIDAFRLITSAQSFTPSEAAEQLVTDQVDLIVETYGAEGEQIIADAGAYAEGINAFWEANGIVQNVSTRRIWPGSPYQRLLGGQRHRS